MSGATRLILLPGLGADERLLEPQRAAFAGLEVPRWRPHRPAETLAEYARRMRDLILPSERFFLGGVSFGGMVALELAQYLRPAGVFLVASCRSGQQIARHLHYFVKFASILPERTFELGQTITPLFVQKFGKLTAEQEALLAEMFAETTPAFVRWGIEAITNWPGTADVAVPVYHIHGSDDQLIPAASVAADVVVPGGGHLLNVTHAAEVNGFIAARLA